jgi:hypothetical protein
MQLIVEHNGKKPGALLWYVSLPFQMTMLLATRAHNLLKQQMLLLVYYMWVGGSALKVILPVSGVLSYTT